MRGAGQDASSALRLRLLARRVQTMWYHRAFSGPIPAGMNVSGSAIPGCGALACHPEPGRAVCERR